MNLNNKFGNTATQNPYLAKDNEKKERKARRSRQIERLYENIADICCEIHNAAYNLRTSDYDNEINVMKNCRKIEDYISDIRRKYKEIEKLKYGDDD